MKIPLSQPDITEKERKAVLDVLKTPNLALGPKLTEFENKFAKYIGTKYAIAVNSGTSGLHLIIKSLGIKKGDGVITSPFSFIASANCILYEGAKPIFVDIDPKTLNIDPNKIEKAITKKTKAILVVDIFGHPADWDKILKIAKKYKLKVIEDSCEALGAKYLTGRSHLPKGRNDLSWQKCGTFGDAATFAFYPNKQITTLGEGGMIVTDNKKIANLCRSMMNQGRKVENDPSASSGQTKWLEHVRLGYNYRMNDAQAAMGIAQLSRIKEILKKRNQVAKLYNDKLKGIYSSGRSHLPKGRNDLLIKLPYIAPWAKISWFVYVIRLNPRGSHLQRRKDPSIRKYRDRILKKLRAKGIQCNNYFQCIHLQPFYKDIFGYKKGNFPIAETTSDHTIALPFYNNLKKNQIKYIVENLDKCLDK